jgi:hypothetical protein
MMPDVLGVVRSVGLVVGFAGHPINLARYYKTSIMLHSESSHG